MRAFTAALVLAGASCGPPSAPRPVAAPAPTPPARAQQTAPVELPGPCVDPLKDATSRWDGRYMVPGDSPGPYVVDNPPDLDGDGQPERIYNTGGGLAVYVMRGACGHYVGDIADPPDRAPGAPWHHGLVDVKVTESGACEGEPCGCDYGTLWFRFDGTAYQLDKAASTYSAPRACPAPSAAPVTSSAPEVPKFARLDVDPEKAFPLRAKLRFSGSRYLRHDAPATAGKRNSVLLPEIVLDADAASTPRRPRLLCDTGDARVAVYVDAQDLGTVALAGAVIEPALMHAAPDDPGVHLSAGALISATLTGDVAHVRYAGLFLRADGVVPRDRVDIVFAPEAAITPPPSDGLLARDVAVRVSPSGAVLARIAKTANVANDILVARLGTVGRFTKIRYDEDDAYVIGWVPSDAVRPMSPSGGEGWGTIGTGRLAPKSAAALARGTLLSDGQTGAIVGVVTASGKFACTADCDGSDPTIRISACGGTVDLRARIAR